MSPRESVERMVFRDCCEKDKHRIFQKLNQLARSRNIAVILHWMGMKDPAGNVRNDMRFQSNGPRGQAETCVFCGKRVRAGDWQRLGHFVSDREYFRDKLRRFRGRSFHTQNGLPTHRDHCPSLCSGLVGRRHPRPRVGAGLLPEFSGPPPCSARFGSREGRLLRRKAC